MTANAGDGNPFLVPGRWYRGNLHMHSTNSDGAKSPADAVACIATPATTSLRYRTIMSSPTRRPSPSRDS